VSYSAGQSLVVHRRGPRRPGEPATERPKPTSGRHESSGPGRHEGYSMSRPKAVIALCAAIAVAYSPYWLGIVHANPALIFSGLGAHMSSGFLGGLPTIDPNEGITSQALGHLAAMDWLHGHVPWWNPFEGLGTPLAGEMQSAALYPLVLLLALPGGAGIMAFHAAGELIAGLATMALLRRLGVDDRIALGGAIAFALGGTYAWLGNAIQNPICWLPVALYALEVMADHARGREAAGWWVLALALAASLYAGFPEVAYLDGLLVAVWALTRLVQLSRFDLLAARSYLASLAMGLVGGLLLSLPVVIPFEDYLRHGYSALTNGQFSHTVLPTSTALNFVAPYSYGTIFDLKAPLSLMGMWSDIGGFVSTGLLTLAVVALILRPRDALRWALAGFTLLAAARIWGPASIVDLWNLLPGMKEVAAYRYFPASMECSVVVLAALGASSLLERRRSDVALAAAALLFAETAVLLGESVPMIRSVDHAGGSVMAVISAAAIVAGFATIVVVVVAARGVTPKSRGWWLLAVFVVPAVGAFIVPELSAPRAGHLDTSPVAYLRAHEGVQRVYSLGGPLSPDYGSELGVAELDISDAPVPAAFHRFIERHLQANLDKSILDGVAVANPAGQSAFEAFLANEPSYAELGVRWVITGPGSDPFAGSWPAADGPPPRLVMRSSVANLYSLVNGASFYQVQPSSGCVLSGERVNSVEVTCARRARLTRMEQWMPGWSATVRGDGERLTPLRSDIGEEVGLPAGRSHVLYSYSPPHLDLALAGFAAGVLLILGGAAFRSRRRGKPRARNRRPAGASSGEGATGLARGETAGISGAGDQEPAAEAAGAFGLAESPPEEAEAAVLPPVLFSGGADAPSPEPAPGNDESP